MRIDIKTIIAVLTLAACVRIPPASAISNDFDTLFQHHQHHHRQTQQIRLRHHNGASRDRELGAESFFDDGEDTPQPSDFPETTSRPSDPLIRPPRHSLGESKTVANYRADTDDRFDWVTDKDLLLSDAAIEEEVEDMASLGFDGGGGRGGHHPHRGGGGGGGGGGRWRKTAREMRREGGGKPVECCPSVTEMVQPVAGKNIEGMFVELYTDGDQQQRFIDRSCRPDVEGRPCRFLDRRLHNQSRCVQKMSYSYALVKDDSNGSAASERQSKGYHHILGEYFPTFPVVSGSGWTLDYIEVRSGCSCEVTPPDLGGGRRRGGRGGGGGSKGKKKGPKKKTLD